MGAGPLGRDDGRVVLALRDQAGLLLPRLGFGPPAPGCPLARPVPVHDHLRAVLAEPGRLLLPGARRRRPRRPGGPRGAVGPGVGRGGDQRLLRRRAGHAVGSAGPARPRRRRCRPGPGGPASGSLERPRAAPWPGPLVPGAPRARARPGPRTATEAGVAVAGAPARAPRRAHPGRGAGRGRAGRLRRGLPGAAGHGGVRAHPAGLLRGRAGRRPVRPARRGRPAAVDARARRRGSAQDARRCSSWPPPTRPTPTGWCCPGR